MRGAGGKANNQSMLALKNVVLADAQSLLRFAQTTESGNKELFELMYDPWITECIFEKNFLVKTPIQKLAALVNSFIRHVVSAS